MALVIDHIEVLVGYGCLEYCKKKAVLNFERQIILVAHNVTTFARLILRKISNISAGSSYFQFL